MQGCLPSHLIFLRRHSSHALVTLRRFCTGMAWCSVASSSDASAKSSVFTLLSGMDPTLPVGEGWSCQLFADGAPESSSEGSGDTPQSILPAAAAADPKPVVTMRDGAAGGGMLCVVASPMVLLPWRFLSFVSNSTPQVWRLVDRVGLRKVLTALP